MAVDGRAERHDVELYLLRHADAVDPGEWTDADTTRPLTATGERQAEALADFLATRRFLPAAIVSSPKVRAAATAELVARALGLNVMLDDRLGERLDLRRLEAILDSVPGRRVLLVGHDPDLSDLAATLSGASYLPLSKGALVRIDVSLPVQPAGGILRWLLPPEAIAAPAT